MQLIQIFAYMSHISAYAIAFFQHFSCPTLFQDRYIFLAASDYRYLQLDVESV